MAELSRPWSGTALGDAGPYSDDQWTDVWKTLLGPVIASQGVFQDQLNVLALGGLAATPVTIDTGRALVNGLWYESNTSVDVAIPTPAGNPRVDRIVLRADWALQTVRITRIAGAEAATPIPPAITQNDGVTWDLPLWQVFITVGGVISIWRDEREFIGQYVPTGATEERVYLETDFFIPNTGQGDDAVVEFYQVETGGSDWLLNQIGIAFGAGGVTLRAVTAGAGSYVQLISTLHRPELIDAHLKIIAKQPNTDANLDRVLGFSDGVVPVLIPTNGVFFRADGAGNWFAVTRAAGVETATDTGQALDDVWRTFEIRQTAANVVVFLIDGVVVANHQADIPAADMFLKQAVFDDGSGGAAGATDYMDLDLLRLTGDR